MNSKILMMVSYWPSLKTPVPMLCFQKGTRRGGSGPTSQSCRSFCGSRRFSASGASLTLVIAARTRTWSTVSANPANVGQALFQCCEPAIRATAVPGIVIGAPLTVSRFSGFFDADDSRENSQDERYLPCVSAGCGQEAPTTRRRSGGGATMGFALWVRCRKLKIRM